MRDDRDITDISWKWAHRFIGAIALFCLVMAVRGFFQ